MSKGKYHTISAWVAVFLWMGLIFYLSHQPASASSQLSGGIVDFFINSIERLLPLINVDGSFFHFIVRKSAHLMAYFILGMLVLHALRSIIMTSWKRLLIAFLLCVLYATSDEIHQLFIPGRSGEVRDVVIDSIGAAGGISLYMLIGKIMKCRLTR